MVETKKSAEVRDYKERFEFKLTVGDNIICQRYFKIFNYNENCVNSYDIADTMRYLANMIDEDLKDKTAVYMEMMCPQIFNTEEEMYQFFANPANTKRLRGGNGIVVKDNTEHDYAWKHDIDADGNVLGGSVMPLTFKFDDGEFSSPLTPEDYVEYKLSFLDNGKEVCATTWTGIYPRYVRNSIDLTNKRGRYEKVDVYTLSFDAYLSYKIFGGRPDYVYKIIKEIQSTCSNENSWYTMVPKR
jgi:hypothetical protein